MLGGTHGANGWFTSAVSVVWQINPAPDPNSIVGCQNTTISADTVGTKVSCSVTWNGGSDTDSKTKVIKIDKAPPIVRPVPQRPADSNGWYNHPVSVSFAGTDVTSLVASCTHGAYTGPSASGAVAGTCTDNAGNVGRATYTLAYDATPPTIKKFGVKSANRATSLTWQVSADTARVEVTRAGGKRDASLSTVYKGNGRTLADKGLRVGTHYRYTLSAYDQASNVARQTVKVTATGALLAPAPGDRVTRAPRLVWLPVSGARYYNVQLTRGGRTIFSAWPRGTSLALPRAWTSHGKTHRLHKGVYRWFVWPGFGAQSASHYGRMLGQSSFLFAR
jgi:hypothetical protein